MGQTRVTGIGEMTFKFKIVEVGDSKDMLPEDVMIEMFKKSFKEHMEDELDEVEVLSGTISFTVEDL